MPQPASVDLRICTQAALLEEFRNILTDSERGAPDKPTRTVSNDRRPTSGTNDPQMPDENAALWNASRTALCLSGGGIRSAAFSLGVLQALARGNLLLDFHYLSTVSGGGYAGAWLAALMRRGDGLATAQAVLSAAGDERLEGLRAYTNFLTPTPGPASADTRASVVLWLRNVLLNWMVFGPAMLALAAVPVLYAWTMACGLGTGIGVVVGLLGLLALLVATVNVCRLIPAHSFPISVPGGTGANAARHETHYRRTIAWGVVAPTLAWSVLAPVTFAAVTNPAWLRFNGPFRPSCIAPEVWDVAASQCTPTRGFGAWLAVGVFVVLLAGYGAAWAAVGQERRPGFLANSVWWVVASSLACGLLLLGAWLGRGLYAEWLAVLGPLWVTGAHVVQSTVYVGLRESRQYADLDREWLAKVNSDKLAPVLVWAALAAAVLVLPLYVQALWAGLAVLVSGPGGAWLAQSARSSLSGNRTPAGSERSWLAGLAVEAAVDMATLVFLALLMMWLARAADGLAHWAVQVAAGSGAGQGSRAGIGEGPGLVVVIASGVAIALWMGQRVNVNRFSMHGVYRNRLVRAFLGTARKEGRNADPYTKFDPGDNLRMKDLYPAHAGAMNAGDDAVAPHPRRGRLFPVINTTLNLTVPKRTAWSERKAAPFTITPLRSGADCLPLPIVSGNATEPAGCDKGVFVRTECYGGGEEEGSAADSKAGFTLGGAMTLSGAAASPAMGSHTRPAVAFMMTLFDVRLGAWLPNPAKTDNADALNHGRPRNALFALLAEMLGRANDQSENIYLSDGGHFDNLGLYEMLRRECRRIVVVDAGQDGGYLYADLGDSVRRVAIDLGAVLTFSPAVRQEIGMLPRGGAYATIAYRSGAVGELIYLKPYLPEGLPVDVMAYAAGHESFPHESTGNQFFTESQFESYRHLGEYLGKRAINRAGNLESWFAGARAQQGMAPGPPPGVRLHTIS